MLWVEEPLAGDDLDGMRMLREQHRRADRRRRDGTRLRSSCAARWTPRRSTCSSPTSCWRSASRGARTLADLALRRNRWFTPHTWTNGIGLLANLHVCCGVGGGPFLEFPYDPPGWTPERRDFMLAEPLEVDDDGSLAIGDAPGLGIELDEDAVAHYAAAAAA